MVFHVTLNAKNANGEAEWGRFDKQVTLHITAK